MVPAHGLVHSAGCGGGGGARGDGGGGGSGRPVGWRADCGLGYAEYRALHPSGRAAPEDARSGGAAAADAAERAPLAAPGPSGFGPADDDDDDEMEELTITADFA